MTWLWPLKGVTPMFPDEPGWFGARRKHDVHTGIDLYCEQGTEVVAVEDGVVVHIEGFTGPNADDPSPWWNDTQAILVEGRSGIVNYGEVTPRVKVGDVIKAGQVIAVIDTAVLKRFKGRPMMMLHLELMVPGVRKILWWRLEEPQPEVLLDPTDKLAEAAGGRLTHFYLHAYDGKSFRPRDTETA